MLQRGDPLRLPRCFYAQYLYFMCLHAFLTGVMLRRLYVVPDEMCLLNCIKLLIKICVIAEEGLPLQSLLRSGPSGETGPREITEKVARKFAAGS